MRFIALKLINTYIKILVKKMKKYILFTIYNFLKILKFCSSQNMSFDRSKLEF